MFGILNHFIVVRGAGFSKGIENATGEVQVQAAVMDAN